MAYIYVSPTGNDTTGDGSELNPYLTIQKAVDQIPEAEGIASDNAIYVATGTYSSGFVCQNKAFSLELDAVTISGTGICFDYTRTGAADRFQMNVIESSTLSYFTGFETLIKVTDSNPTTSNQYTISLQSLSFDGLKLEANYMRCLFITQCSMIGVEFVNSLMSATIHQSFPSAIDYCNLTDAVNVPMFGTIENELTPIFTGFFRSNNCTNAELLISDIASRGYSHLYLEPFGNTLGNTLDGAKVKFSASDITLSALALIPFATVYTLPQMQAKADLDMGAGHTMHADSFIFSIVPVPPEDQPNPATRRFPAIGGMCFIENRPRVSRSGLLGGWDSSRILLNDGLVSTGYNSVFAENDLAQADPTKQPQYGYDKLAGWNKTNAVVVGANVTGITNTETTPQAFGNLTAASGTEPQLISGNVVLQAGDKFSVVSAARTLRQFTIHNSFMFDTIESTLDFFSYKLGGLNPSAIEIGIYKNGSGFVSFLSRQSLNNSRVISTSFEGLTAAGFSAKYSNSTIDLFVSFSANRSQLRVYKNRVLAASIITSIGFDTLSIAALSYEFAKNNTSSGNLTLYASNFYETYLTDAEIAKLVEQSADYTYQLPKNAFTATGLSIMQAALLANQTLNEFSAWAWVYIQTTRTTDGEGTLIASDTASATTDKGFVLVQKRASSLYSFVARFGNGTNGWAVGSAALSKTNFEAAYLNKWTLSLATFKNGVSTLYLNGAQSAKTTGAAGSITMPVAGLVSIMGRAGVGDMQAGNKLENIGISKRALNAADAVKLFQESKSKFRHLNNLP